MYRNLRLPLVVLGLLTVSGWPAATAAAAPAQEQAPARTVTRKVTPPYPEMARKAHLEGTVKLSVVVARDGKVKSVAVTGGHPIFAAAATGAAKQWQFTPAAKESTQPLVFDFKHPDK